MSVSIEFHGHQESGTDSLSGKQGEVYVVTFADGTVTESPLSLKSVAQLLKMKLAQKQGSQTKLQAAIPVAVRNGHE